MTKHLRELLGCDLRQIRPTDPELPDRVRHRLGGIIGGRYSGLHLNSERDLISLLVAPGGREADQAIHDGGDEGVAPFSVGIRSQLVEQLDQERRQDEGDHDRQDRDGKIPDALRTLSQVIEVLRLWWGQAAFFGATAAAIFRAFFSTPGTRFSQPLPKVFQMLRRVRN
jgi:hypothetical protein